MPTPMMGWAEMMSYLVWAVMTYLSAVLEMTHWTVVRALTH